MAYTDGLTVLHDAAREIEAGAGVTTFAMPMNVTVLQFGALVIEDFVDNDADVVLVLQTRPTKTGSAVEKVLLNIGDEVAANLKKGDGRNPAVTAMTSPLDIDNGHVVIADPLAFPFTLQAGEILEIGVKTAAATAGGAVRAFAVIRVDGTADGARTDVWTDTKNFPA